MNTPIAGRLPSCPLLGAAAVVILRSASAGRLAVVSYTGLHCADPEQEPPLTSVIVNPFVPPTCMDAGKLTLTPKGKALLRLKMIRVAVVGTSPATPLALGLATRNDPL